MEAGTNIKNDKEDTKTILDINKENGSQAIEIIQSSKDSKNIESFSLFKMTIKERKLIANESEYIKSPSELEVDRVNNEGGFLVGISKDEEEGKKNEKEEKEEKENIPLKSGKSNRNKIQSLSSIRRRFTSSNSAFVSCKSIFYLIIYIFSQYFE